MSARQSTPLPNSPMHEKEDDELSLMSDSEDELPSRFASLIIDRQAPQTWSEVDVDRMQRMALSIARQALPAAENTEPAPHVAMSTGPSELDTTDPLGFGQLDLKTMQLVRIYLKCCQS